MGDESATTSPSQAHPVRLALSNLALLATVFAFVTVAIRALVVARLDPTTAVALVQTSGPVNVFVGTLTAELSAFLLAAVYAVGFFQYRTPSGPRPSYFYFVFGAVLLINLIASHWIYTLVLLATGSQFLTLMKVPDDVRAGRRLSLAAVALMASIGGGMFLFSSSLWLPREVLTVEDGASVVGYVLEEEGLWVSVLQETNRELRLVEETTITSRRPCGTADPLVGPSVVQLVRDLLGDAPDPPSYSDCPD